MRYAADGSILCQLQATPPAGAGVNGLFTIDGYLRVSTAVATGQYTASGGLRVEISNDAGSPPSGTGYYNTRGNIRCTTSGSTNFNHPGVYAKDGSLKITLVP